MGRVCRPRLAEAEKAVAEIGRGRGYHAVVCKMLIISCLKSCAC